MMYIFAGQINEMTETLDSYRNMLRARVAELLVHQITQSNI